MWSFFCGHVKCIYLFIHFIYLFQVRGYLVILLNSFVTYFCELFIWKKCKGILLNVNWFKYFPDIAYVLTTVVFFHVIIFWTFETDSYIIILSHLPFEIFRFPDLHWLQGSLDYLQMYKCISYLYCCLSF